MALNRATVIGVVTFGISFVAGTWLWSNWGYSRALAAVEAVSHDVPGEHAIDRFVLTYDDDVNRAELLSDYEISGVRMIGMNAYQFHVTYANGSEHDLDVFPSLLGKTQVYVH